MAEINKNLQKEGEKYNKEFRSFRGCFTQAARNALPDGKFWYLENLQPVGDANLQSIYDQSASLVNYAANVIYWSQSANIGGVEYLFNFATNGGIYAFNTGTNASVLINGAALLSGTGSRLAQWNNTQALFIDSTGYYHWDGTTFAKITGTGVPTSGTEIAVYSGRVWIFQGRALTVSGPDDYTAAAFAVAVGASVVPLTDPTLLSNVTRAIVANGYLYYAGVSSIAVISDLYVPTDATGAAVVPPAPLFNNQNIQATIGSDQPGSFFTINRDVYFANAYGVYNLEGVEATRISSDIDGTWQYRDPAQLISGGALVTNSILHGAMIMKRLNDPNFGNNTIICMYADKKWWFANYGALTFVVPAVVGGFSVLYGFRGNQLYKLFSLVSSAPAFIASTALWPMEDALADKEVINAGFEIEATNIFQPFTATLDQPNGSTPLPAAASAGQVIWQNNALQTVGWINNASAVVTWFSGQYLLYWSTAPGMSAKYVGMTITGQGIFKMSGFFMDYKIRARWGGGVQ